MLAKLGWCAARRFRSKRRSQRPSQPVGRPVCAARQTAGSRLGPQVAGFADGAWSSSKTRVAASIAYTDVGLRHGGGGRKGGACAAQSAATTNTARTAALAAAAAGTFEATDLVGHAVLMARAGWLLLGLRSSAAPFADGGRCDGHDGTRAGTYKRLCVWGWWSVWEDGGLRWRWVRDVG